MPDSGERPALIIMGSRRTRGDRQKYGCQTYPVRMDHSLDEFNNEQQRREEEKET